MTESWDGADAHTLAGAYAIGAVDAAEEALFEQHLVNCAECREEQRGLREALVRLAESSAVTPPPQLKQRLMADIARTPQEAPAGQPAAPQTAAAQPTTARPAASQPAATQPVVPQPRRETGLRSPWLVAAALAVFAMVGGGIAWSEHRAASSARQVAGAAQREAGSAQQAAAAAQRVASVLGDPAAQRVSGAATGGGTVQLVVAQGAGVVVTSKLPALGAGSVYQLWIVAASGVSSAGLGPGGAQAAGQWTRLVTGLRGGDTMAISVEPSGGSRQPTTVPIVALKA